ncbi:MAG: Ig-like domain-containing protein [Iamia sp.]
MASFTFSQVAGAQYAPTVCTVTVSPTTVAAGGTVTLSGTVTDSPTPRAPISGQTVSFSVDGQDLGSTTTDADGNFSLQVVIPADLSPGSQTIVANCGPGPDGDILGNTDIVVTGGGGGTNPPGTSPGGGNQGNQGNQGGGTQGSQGGGTLARTGTDLGLPVQIGVGLLAMGGIVLALSASRRRTSAA